MLYVLIYLWTKRDIHVDEKRERPTPFEELEIKSGEGETLEGPIRCVYFHWKFGNGAYKNAVRDRGCALKLAIW